MRSSIANVRSSVRGNYRTCRRHFAVLKRWPPTVARARLATSSRHARHLSSTKDQGPKSKKKTKTNDPIAIRKSNGPTNMITYDRTALTTAGGARYRIRLRVSLLTMRLTSTIEYGCRELAQRSLTPGSTDGPFPPWKFRRVRKARLSGLDVFFCRSISRSECDCRSRVARKRRRRVRLRARGCAMRRDRRGRNLVPATKICRRPGCMAR